MNMMMVALSSSYVKYGSSPKLLLSTISKNSSLYSPTDTVKMRYKEKVSGEETNE